MLSLLDKTIEYINSIFEGNSIGIKHFERTMFWFQKIYPEATEAMLIAAYGHDIERWFRDPQKAAPENYLDEAFLTYHQTKGADLLCEFLAAQDADKQTLDTVRHLVERHELWGDQLQNILKDADSMSFLETNANKFVDVKYTEGYEKVKEKIDWMYERIWSEDIKSDAKNLYEPLMERLRKNCNIAV